MTGSYVRHLPRSGASVNEVDNCAAERAPGNQREPVCIFFEAPLDRGLAGAATLAELEEGVVLRATDDRGVTQDLRLRVVDHGERRGSRCPDRKPTPTD